jgi:hypothetical protein
MLAGIGLSLEHPTSTTHSAARIPMPTPARLTA